MLKHYRVQSILDSEAPARRLGLETAVANSPLDDGQPAPVQAFKATPSQVTWASLPRKRQLFILFLCRVVDFLQVASLQAYAFYQLRSFAPSLSAAEISTQAGVLQGAFTGAQVLTAVFWGRIADNGRCGRKLVLLFGLAGTALSCLGGAFATSFGEAVGWRIIGGAINGMVGIMYWTQEQITRKQADKNRRTMIAEITVEKKFQSRAFLILPMSFNVAGVLGPMMGGMLAEPASTMPKIFGPGKMLDFQWIRSFPYAPPSALNAVILAVTFLVVLLGLEETLAERKGKYDAGLAFAKQVRRFFNRSAELAEYEMLATDATDHLAKKGQGPRRVFEVKGQKLPFRSIWTRNVVLTLVTTAFFDFHLGAFTNLWSIFLSTPRSTSRLATHSAGLYSFSGGLGMPASTVGFATSILGMLGMILQIFMYPSIQARLGTIRSFRYFLVLFPIAYFLAPYLAILPSTIAAPAPASGLLMWVGVTLVLFLQVAARTFALPATIILLNNCSPHPSVLGLIHSIGQSVSAAFRTIGPIVAGSWYGFGLEHGVVGTAWWAVAGVAVAGCLTASWVYEGSGHEVFLEGELEVRDRMVSELGQTVTPACKVEGARLT